MYPLSKVRRSASPPQRRNRTLSPSLSRSNLARKDRITLTSVKGGIYCSTTMKCTTPLRGTTDATRYVEFLVDPGDHRSIPFQQLAPLFQVMSSYNSLLSSSVPQEFTGNDGQSDPARTEEVWTFRNDLRESNDATFILAWSIIKTLF